MNFEPTEDLMVLFNCSATSVEIYRNRLRVLMNMLSKNAGATFNNSYGDFVFRCETLVNLILHLKQEDGKDYSTLSKKNFLDVAIKETTLLSMPPITPASWHHDEKSWSEYKEKAIGMLTLEKMKLEAIYLERMRESIDYDELALRVETLPKNSMRYFLMKIFLEVPVRDDMQLRVLKPNEEPDGEDNTLHFDETNGRWVVTIRKSKNLKDESGRKYILSEELSIRFSIWIKTLAEFCLQTGVLVRGSTNRYPFGIGKHSGLVGRVLGELGFKYKGSNINMIRRAVANKAKTAQEKAAAALLSLHSVATAQTAYESNVSLT